MLSLTASPMKRRDEEKAPLMLITIPKSDYCELTDKFKLKTYKNSEYSIPKGGNEIIFDSYQYNWNGTTEFYLGDDLVGTITTDVYIFYAPTGTSFNQTKENTMANKKKTAAKAPKDKGYEKELAKERFVSNGKGITITYPDGKVVKH